MRVLGKIDFTCVSTLDNISAVLRKKADAFDRNGVTLFSEICYNIGMYIEFVIADNFLLTFLAGAAAARLCHKRENVFRLMIASTVGTVFAVFYPYMRVGAAANLAIKGALGVVLCMILYFKTRRPITSSLLFLGCTFAFGGASYALGLIIYSSASGASEFSMKYPLFLTLGTGAAVYMCVKYAAKKLVVARARAPYEFGTEIEIFGEKLTFDAFLDTGNSVFDEKSGLPVVITDCARFTSKLGESGAREFLKNIDRFRSLEIVTAAGRAKAYILKPTAVTVYSDGHGHKINAMLGIVGGGKFCAAHEMLLGPAIASEGL